MVFENEKECIMWLKKVDLEEENAKIIAVMELTELYQDVHQAIETLTGYSSISKNEWLQIYDEYCMTY